MKAETLIQLPRFFPRPRGDGMKLLPANTAAEQLATGELVLIWLCVVLALAIVYWSRLDEALASTDNVMRLVEVRRLLDGAPWFNPHEVRLDPPGGYDTHWSRLIDAAIAGLVIAFRQVASPDLAERLARCVWPLLVSGPAVAGVTAIAARLAGAGAARVAFFIALMTVALYGTFRPGEIDHHNVQVALSLMLLACAVWCEERSHLAAIAGVVGGLLLSIGLEAAYVVVAVAIVLALLMVRDVAWSPTARRFAFALAAATFAGYLAVTPTAFRFVPECDALAVNSMVAIVLGAAGMGLVALLGVRSTPLARFVGLGIPAALAVAAFVAMEPRCLRGPFGLVDPSLVNTWLDHVAEMQSVPELFRAEGALAAGYVAFAAVAALCVIWVVRSGLRTPVAWSIVASFAISFAIAIGQNRALMYVNWLGVPFVAVTADLLAMRARRAALVRLGVALIASPAVLTLAAVQLASLWTIRSDNAAPHKHSEACFKPESYRALAALPQGLVFASLDFGPSILANTRHNVVAAPYHRIDRAVLFDIDIMTGPVTGNEQHIIDRGVDYVVTCSELAAKPGSLEAALIAGTVGPWLEPVPVPEGDVMRIWRVVPTKIPPASDPAH